MKKEKGKANEVFPLHGKKNAKRKIFFFYGNCRNEILKIKF